MSKKTVKRNWNVLDNKISTLHNNGFTTRGIARQLGLPQTTLLHRLEELGLRWDMTKKEGCKWNWDHLDPILFDMRSQNISFMDMEKLLGVPEKTIRDRWRKIKSKPAPAHIIEEKRGDYSLGEKYREQYPEGHESADDMLKKMIELQDFDHSFRIEQYLLRVALPTRKPVALSFMSDLHIGNPFTDYRSILRDTHAIRHHAQFYMAAGGDWEDNFLPGFRSATAVADQLTKPQNQLVISEKIYKDMAGKIIVKGPGNHDIRVEAKTGVSPNYFVMKGVKIPWMKYGGLLKLTVGETEYNILWKHKWRYNSSLNVFNSLQRMIDMLYPESDIVVQEHTHSPAMQTKEQYEFDAKHQIVYLRTGSYLLGDPYSKELFKEGVPGPQTVVLFPDKKKAVPFTGYDAIEDASIYLKGLK